MTHFMELNLTLMKFTIQELKYKAERNEGRLELDKDAANKFFLALDASMDLIQAQSDLIQTQGVMIKDGHVSDLSKTEKSW